MVAPVRCAVVPSETTPTDRHLRSNNFLLTQTQSKLGRTQRCLTRGAIQISFDNLVGRTMRALMIKDRAYGKEALAFFPLFGTVLAVTFDVGYFIKLDFNLFNVFSVSDHVSFAIQLIPFIAVASLVVVINSFLEGYVKRGELIARARTFWILVGILAFSTLAALLTYWFSKSYVLIFAAIVGAGADDSFTALVRTALFHRKEQPSGGGIGNTPYSRGICVGF